MMGLAARTEQHGCLAREPQPPFGADPRSPPAAHINLLPETAVRSAEMRQGHAPYQPGFERTAEDSPLYQTEADPLPAVTSPSDSKGQETVIAAPFDRLSHFVMTSHKVSS